MPGCLVVQVVSDECADEDIVGLAQDFSIFLFYFTEDPYPQARARKRVALDYFRRQSQLFAQFAYFVLEQLAQGFEQFQVHEFRQSPHVMV